MTETKIAILRGINLGATRKILMQDLRSLCEGLGWTEVRTYIQSGNIIFTSHDELSDLEDTLEQAILEKYGFEVPVIVRDAAEFTESCSRNPLLELTDDHGHLYLTTLKTEPDQENIAEVLAADTGDDRLAIAGRYIFVYAKGSYHQTKLTNTFFERKLKVACTTRNWKTTLKLIELSAKS
ncbi:DUF1697 domain-containing protein [Boudabousia marimammalium]|uniref:DUF1697 domain-containing protein n=1 Tax=Boudabousia marimammalium TaxID=156892 RepID=A0A1Q5PRV0_9ACTO|nr:DUF1697 domain-containing protein [Boudabousia marimammalium]OKL50307.1 hypothetical protein BM477_02665 [Boudabousia marimammalium]